MFLTDFSKLIIHNEKNVVFILLDINMAVQVVDLSDTLSW